LVQHCPQAAWLFPVSCLPPRKDHLAAPLVTEMVSLLSLRVKSSFPANEIQHKCIHNCFTLSIPRG
jgi:hypothetical protein